MVIPPLKPFVAGLTITGLAAAAAWLIIRHSADRLNRVSAEVPSAIAAPPPILKPSPPSATDDAERRWHGLRTGDSLTASQWAAFDAVPDAEVPAWARRLSAQSNPLLCRMILQRWATLDGVAAMASLKSAGLPIDPDAPAEFNLLDSMLACWIAADPTGGAAGLRQHLATLPPDAPLPESALESLASRDFTATLDAAVILLAPNATTQRRQFLGLNHTARLLATQAKAPAKRELLKSWLHRHPDPTIRGQIFAWVYRHFDPSLAGPARLRDYLPGSDALPDDVRHPDAIWAILPYTESTDPVTAFAAHRQLMKKADSSASNHLVQAVRSWSHTDPEAAGQWLAAQPPSPLIDQARRAYAGAIVDDDPAAALAWASSITDPGWRSIVCGNLFPRWRQLDPAAAHAWLATAPLSPTQRHFVAGRAKLAGAK